MANAKMCDICGKFYPMRKMERGVSVTDCLSVGVIDGNKFEVIDGYNYEICPECKTKIDNYIRELKGCIREEVTIESN